MRKRAREREVERGEKGRVREVERETDRVGGEG